MASIFDNIFNYKDKIALIDDKEQLSYSDIFNNIKQLDKISNNRDLILFLTEISISCVELYIHSIVNRNVPIMLDSQTNIINIKAIIQSYKPKFLYIPRSLCEQFKDIKHYTLIANYKNYDIYMSKFPIPMKLFDDLALTLSSSGSTGSPKIIRVSYKNILSNTIDIVNYLSLSSEDKSITTLPFNYSYGLSVLNTHLYVGGSLVITNYSVLQREFWNLIDKHNITNINGVPYTYYLLEKIGFLKKNPTSLKFLTQAGGKLSLELIKKLDEFCKLNNIKLFIMYGATEATARMSYLEPKYAVEKLGSIGKGINNNNFFIVDSNTGEKICKPFILGELYFKGNNVTLGYANSYKDLELADCNNGILNTGDLAHFDEDGFVYIDGRIKRIIKLLGNRFSLDHIEQLLSQELNCNCICSGIDDKLYIFTCKDSLCNLIKKFLNTKLKINSRLFKIVVLDSFPYNNNGKIAYKELEKYYE